MRFGTSILSSNWLLQKISASECGKPKPSWTINYMGGNPSPHDKLPPGYPTIPVMAGLSPTIPNYPGCGWTTPNYPAGLSRWTIPLDYPQLSRLWLDYPQLSPTIPNYPSYGWTIPTIPNYPGCGWTIPNYPQLSQLWLDYPQLSRWTIPNYPSCGWTIPNYPQLSQFWHWHSSFVPSTSVGGTSTGTACSEQRLGQSGWPWRPDGDETVTLPIRGERGKNTAKLIMIDLWKTVDLSGKYGGTGKKNADLKLRLRFLSINTYDSIIKVGISIRRNIKQRKFRS